MTEQVKFIVKELNQEPFNRGYNLITFDSLEPLSLLQVLTDVLAEIEPKQKIDVREEAADQTAIRIFSILRVLKYKPPSDPTGLENFRKGIVQGDKHVIYPVIEWLFKRMPELKDRAYLARYLVRVDIPADFMVDAQLADLYEQYEQLMRTFMETHKQMMALKNSGFSTADIKKDIASMEDEKDQLIKRVDRLKRKVEAAPNSAPMLAVARNLRVERDREEQIQKQKHEQRSAITQIEQRLQRLQHQIKEAKQAAVGMTPQSIIQNLEEESNTNKYMVADVHPKEIAALKKVIQNLQKIVTEPAMGQSDLDAINQQIRQMNAEINQLVEKRMMSGDPMEDKLSLFRQQAAIVSRKKKGAAEALQQTREELARLEAEAQEKRNRLQQSGAADTVLRDDEFKAYVYKLRGKNDEYRRKKSELLSLRAEVGILSRTDEVLTQRNDEIDRKMSAHESSKGVSGYRSTQDALENVSTMKSEYDQMKGKTLEDISQMVQRLTARISKKKEVLAPMIQELRPLRQQAQDMAQDYNEKKMAYNSVSAGLESNRSKLEQEVHALREEISAEESRYHSFSARLRMLELQQQRVAEEAKLYTSSDQADKKKSYRDQYNRKISEQENLGKGLREKQKSLRDNQESSAVQARMWRDVERLMEMKRHLATGGGSASSDLYNNRGGSGEPAAMSKYGDEDENRLVL